MEPREIVKEYGADFLQYLIICWPEWTNWNKEEIDKKFKFYVKTEFNKEL